MKRTLEDIRRDAKPEFLELPTVKEAMAPAEEAVSNPTSYIRIAWTKWAALFSIVALGLWAGLSAFRGLRSFSILAFVSSALYLLREAVFNSAVYHAVFAGPKAFALLWEKAPLAVLSTLWFDVLVPLFFLSVMLFVATQLLYQRRVAP